MGAGVPLKDVVDAMVKEERTEASSVEKESDANYDPIGVKDAHPTPSTGKLSIRSKVGSFLNSTAMQLILTALLFLTSFTSAILAVLPIHTTYVTIMILQAALQALASFTTTLFFLEVMAQAYGKGLSFSKHPGYLLDLLIIGLTVYSQAVTSSSINNDHIHALSFLRYWRLVAIVVRIIANVEAAHDGTIAKLAESQATNKTLKAQLRLMEDRRGDDVQHRSEVEALCVEYKNEIDTLMMALQFAASDVAGWSGSRSADGAVGEMMDVTKIKVENSDDVGAGTIDDVSIGKTVEE